MTAYEIWNQIDNFVMNTETNEAVGNAIRKLQCENKEDEAVAYIKDFFKCDNQIAKDVFKIFKREMGEPPSQQQIAYANAVAREWQNKPKCPTCNSTNVKPISALKRGESIATIGVFSNKINKSFEYKNCGYTW